MRSLLRRLGVGLVLLLLAHAGRAEDFAIDITTGYQLGNFRWSIGVPGTNILSELTWSEMRTAVIEVEGMWRPRPGVELTGSALAGWVVDGKNQDSDYNSDNRQDEYSRSVNSADDGMVLSLDGTVAHRIPVTSGLFVIKPSLSLLMRQQRLRMTDGYQVVSQPPPPASPLGPIEGLDSRYVATWSALAVGVEAVSMKGGVELTARMAYALSSFYAWADWNLRTDFKHPKSFEHVAFGNGVLTAAQIDIPLRPNLGLQIAGTCEIWWTWPGKDWLYYADGRISVSRLNEVRWWSLGASVGLSYRL